MTAPKPPRRGIAYEGKTCVPQCQCGGTGCNSKMSNDQSQTLSGAAQPAHDSFSKGYTHRHGEPVSDACGEGRHAECTEDFIKCHCTFRFGHTTSHAYMNPPAAAPEEAPPPLGIVQELREIAVYVQSKGMGNIPQKLCKIADELAAAPVAVPAGPRQDLCKCGHRKIEHAPQGCVPAFNYSQPCDCKVFAPAPPHQVAIVGVGRDAIGHVVKAIQEQTERAVQENKRITDAPPLPPPQEPTFYVVNRASAEASPPPDCEYLQDVATTVIDERDESPEVAEISAALPGETRTEVGYRIEYDGDANCNELIRASDGESIFSDCMEPEDALLTRDLKPLVYELNTMASRIAQLERERDVLQGIVARPSVPLKEYLHEADRAETAEAALTQAQADKELVADNLAKALVTCSEKSKSVSALMEAIEPFANWMKENAIQPTKAPTELQWENLARVYEQVKRDMKL